MHDLLFSAVLVIWHTSTSPLEVGRLAIMLEIGQEDVITLTLLLEDLELVFILSPLNTSPLVIAGSYTWPHTNST